MTTTAHSPRPATATSTTATALDPARLRRAKFAYTTRHVAADVAAASAEGFALRTDVTPRVGDVVLARVTEIGKHTRLEGPGSRRQLLFPGDEVVVAYGARYAPDQFLAELPSDLGPCDLVAAGGVAGEVVAQRAGLAEATRLEPLGVLADATGRVTLARSAPYAVGPRRTDPEHREAGAPLVVAVLGTSMNSGKSTTVANVVNGLCAGSLVVSAGKATGTGAGNDTHLFHDAGAVRALDFTDFGLPSTYRVDADDVLALWHALLDELVLDGPDVVVVEIADGLFQAETSRLLADPGFAGRVDAVLFAAQDAVGAASGVEVLRRHDLPVVAASGLLTASPLAVLEARAALGASGVPVLGGDELRDPHLVGDLLTATR